MIALQRFGASVLSGIGARVAHAAGYYGGVRGNAAVPCASQAVAAYVRVTTPE